MANNTWRTGACKHPHLPPGGISYNQQREGQRCAFCAPTNKDKFIFHKINIMKTGNFKSFTSLKILWKGDWSSKIMQWFKSVNGDRNCLEVELHFFENLTKSKKIYKLKSMATEKLICWRQKQSEQNYSKVIWTKKNQIIINIIQFIKDNKCEKPVIITYYHHDYLGIELLILSVIPRESLDGVRNIQTTVGSSFHRSEHLGSSWGTGKTDVQSAS